MDIAAREMVPGEKFGLSSFDATLPPPVENPGGVAALVGEELRAEQPVAYTDMDINRHVNNARYVDWLCDRFPYEWHEKHRLERLLVHFVSGNAAGRGAGDDPDHKLDTAFTFSGGRDGKARFLMSGQFAQR